MSENDNIVVSTKEPTEKLGASYKEKKKPITKKDLGKNESQNLTQKEKNQKFRLETIAIVLYSGGILLFIALVIAIFCKVSMENAYILLCGSLTSIVTTSMGAIIGSSVD